MRMRVFAEFASAESMLAAIDRMREGGYRRIESYSPFEIPGAAKALGLKRSLLPWFVAAAGAMGLVLAYAIQWYADTWDYPLNVGNRPVHPILAYIPATFEGTVLVASLAAFFGLWLILRLPKLWDPVFEIDGFERATIDRFWLSVECRDAEFDAERAARMFGEAGALRTVRMEDNE
jgi:hypothetical protein